MKYFTLITILLITFDNCKSAIDLNTLFLTKNPFTYNEILHLCKSRGMKLVRIDNAEDNTALRDFANKLSVDFYFIDGNDQNAEGVFVDAYGKLLTYKPFGNTEPNGGRFENCLALRRVDNGAWIDVSCTVNRYFGFCQKDPNQVTTDQLEIEGSMFIASRTKMSFADAQEYCISRGLRMIRINHALDNAVVHDFARETKSDLYWIDANDIVTEGKWVDSDGKELVHKNFHPNEPNGNRAENCGHGYFNLDGLWNDIRCDFQMWAICYSDTDRGVTTDPNVLIASLERYTWMEARDYCKAQGLKLVKPTNAGENALVHGFSRRIWSDIYWLDGNDYKTEGRWVDLEENDLKHKGFHPAEPNGGRAENCLNGYLFLDGLWNDAPCDLKNLFAICSAGGLRLPYNYNYDLDADNMMVSTERYTYNEALYFCRTRGTQLVRVRNSVENGMLAAFAKKVVAEYYWIDGNDYTEEGKWVDANGDVLPYKNWALKEPNGNRVENCLVSYHLDEGTWNDTPCGNKHFAICSRNPYEDDQAIDFHFTRSKMTFESAQSYCRSLGLVLIRIRDAETNKLINLSSIRHKLENYWIDGNDNEEEGKWVDSNRNVYTYKNFNSGEPSGGREKNCLQGTKSGFWFDDKCTNSNAVICFGVLKKVIKF